MNYKDHTFYYDEVGHKYFIDGTRVPGVSTIAKVPDHSRPMMYWSAEQVVECLGRNCFFRDDVLWFRPPPTDKGEQPPAIPVDKDNYKKIFGYAQDEHKRFTAAAAERGNRLHDACHKYALHEDQKIDPDIQKQFDDFRRWADKYKLRPIWTEKMVWSVQYMFAGTFDTLCILELPKRGPVNFLIDYKSSKRLYDSHIIQSGGYKIAHDEQEGPMDLELGVLVMPQNGTDMIWADLSGQSEEIEVAFLQCLYLHQALKPVASAARKINAKRKKE